MMKNKKRKLNQTQTALYLSTRARLRTLPASSRRFSRARASAAGSRRGAAGLGAGAGLLAVLGGAGEAAAAGEVLGVAGLAEAGLAEEAAGTAGAEAGLALVAGIFGMGTWGTGRGTKSAARVSVARRTSSVNTGTGRRRYSAYMSRSMSTASSTRSRRDCGVICRSRSHTIRSSRPSTPLFPRPMFLKKKEKKDRQSKTKNTKKKRKREIVRFKSQKKKGRKEKKKRQKQFVHHTKAPVRGQGVGATIQHAAVNKRKRLRT